MTYKTLLTGTQGRVLTLFAFFIGEEGIRTSTSHTCSFCRDYCCVYILLHFLLLLFSSSACLLISRLFLRCSQVLWLSPLLGEPRDTLSCSVKSACPLVTLYL